MVTQCFVSKQIRDTFTTSEHIEKNSKRVIIYLSGVTSGLGKDKSLVETRLALSVQRSK